MKTLLSLIACFTLTAGCSGAFAHGAGWPTFGSQVRMFGSPKFSGGTLVIPKGTTSGPVTVTNPPTTQVINNGTVNGGASPGITVTGPGPTPTTVTNNGIITSDSTGITISGDSSNVVNSGTISVQSKGTSSATATGISQGN
jgi:hypothetical protein